jgi:hypothetical protein
MSKLERLTVQITSDVREKIVATTREMQISFAAIIRMALKDLRAGARNRKEKMFAVPIRAPFRPAVAATSVV